MAAPLFALVLGACSHDAVPWDGLGPTVPLAGVARISDAVSGVPIRIELVALRCNSHYCFVLQNVTNLGKQRERLSWPESFVDAKGDSHSSCCGQGFSLAGANIPPGVTQPMFAEWSLPRDLTLVALDVGGQRIPLPRPLNLAQQEADPTPVRDFGPETPIGITVSARTSYGEFTVRVDSIACADGQCRITEHAAGLDPDPNWWDYPVYQQQAVDAAGGRRTTQLLWPGQDPRYGEMVRSAGLGSGDGLKEFYATYDVPDGMTLSELLIPGTSQPVRLPSG